MVLLFSHLLPIPKVQFTISLGFVDSTSKAVGVGAVFQNTASFIQDTAKQSGRIMRPHRLQLWKLLCYEFHTFRAILDSTVTAANTRRPGTNSFKDVKRRLMFTLLPLLPASLPEVLSRKYFTQPEQNSENTTRVMKKILNSCTHKNKLTAEERCRDILEDAKQMMSKW